MEREDVMISSSGLRQIMSDPTTLASFDRAALLDETLLDKINDLVLQSGDTSLIIEYAAKSRSADIHKINEWFYQNGKPREIIAYTRKVALADIPRLQERVNTLGDDNDATRFIKYVLGANLHHIQDRPKQRKIKTQIDRRDRELISVVFEDRQQHLAGLNNLAASELP